MSFFNDLSPVGKILCGAALVVAAPVAAAAAIPVCAAIGTVETAATTIGTTLGGVGLAEAVKDVRQ